LQVWLHQEALERAQAEKADEKARIARLKAEREATKARAERQRALQLENIRATCVHYTQSRNEWLRTLQLRLEEQQRELAERQVSGSNVRRLQQEASRALAEYKRNDSEDSQIRDAIVHVVSVAWRDGKSVDRIRTELSTLIPHEFNALIGVVKQIYRVRTEIYQYSAMLAASRGWTCTACTFWNAPAMPKCEMCETPRPTTHDGGD